ncbi:hypothetical protein VLK31_21565 [Variovorax sp. H27-G14]|uniref:hypothetical protein n=1 Tax=Variovorax sp. H27-G14 TaxID=3111914 RepID=UPI0038FC77D5
MSSHSHRAAQELNALPPSPKKSEALAALEDIRESEQRTNAAVERLELTLAALSPSPREQGVFRLLPWLAGLLAIAAIASGIDAIWTSESCSRGRSGVSCVHGPKAQLQGAATVAVGLILAIIPMRSSVWKWTVAALLAALVYGLLIASLLN